MGTHATRPCCIYAIKCLKTGRIYIGRTQRSVEQRINEHFRELKEGWKGRCSSIGKNVWQEDYDRHGLSSFVGYILKENVPPEIIDKEEDAFIAKYKSNDPEHGYNAICNHRSKTVCVVEIVREFPS